jgi:two-component system alkaline phosphatase synthesis response regulator PhoP
MAGEKILVVDDDDDILLIVQTILGGAGYSAHTARNGREGVETALELRPDLILLDVMMPELSGWEVCTTLKSAPETRQIPIAMLTVKSEIRDLITGMQVGADDYITKPFSPRELVARMKAVLRRSEPQERHESMTLADVVLDRQSHDVSVAGASVELTAKEFDLLAFFMANTGIVVSRDTLLDRVWGVEYPGGTRTVDVHVAQLRRKLGRPDLIRTLRGAGYKAVAP